MSVKRKVDPKSFALHSPTFDSDPDEPFVKAKVTSVTVTVDADSDSSAEGKVKKPKTERKPRKSRFALTTQNADRFETLMAEKKQILQKTELLHADHEKIKQINETIQSIAVEVLSNKPVHNVNKYRLESLGKHKQYLANIEKMPAAEMFGKCRNRDAEILRTKKVISKLEAKLEAKIQQK